MRRGLPQTPQITATSEREQLGSQATSVSSCSVDARRDDRAHGSGGDLTRAPRLARLGEQIAHLAGFDRSLGVALAHPGAVPKPRGSRRCAIDATHTARVRRVSEPSERGLGAVHLVAQRDQVVRKLDVRQVRRIELDENIDRRAQRLDRTLRRERHTNRHVASHGSKPDARAQQLRSRVDRRGKRREGLHTIHEHMFVVKTQRLWQ